MKPQKIDMGRSVFLNRLQLKTGEDFLHGAERENRKAFLQKNGTTLKTLSGCKYAAVTMTIINR